MNESLTTWTDVALVLAVCLGVPVGYGLFFAILFRALDSSD